MPTISMRNDLMRWLVALVLAVSLPARAAIDAAIGSDGRLRVESKHTRVTAQMTAPARHPLRVDTALAREIGTAQAFFAVGKRAFVQDNTTWLLVVTQTESRANHEASACGSGTEDMLRLVEVDVAKARLVERSSLLLQSCLTGLSLNDDSGRSLQDALEAVPDPEHLRLNWLNHPEYEDQVKTLTIVDGTIKLR